MPTELHLALQSHYAGPDGLVEASLDGYKVDALREGVVYEIQTGNFPAIRKKLEKLCKQHPVVLVYPIPETKIVVRIEPESGAELSARRSPKHGVVADVFVELLYLAGLLRRGKLALEVVMTVERELRCDDGKGSWRRKRVSLLGRELLEIVATHRFQRPADFLRLLPEDLPKRFTVTELAQATGAKRWVAGRMAYALRELGAIKHVGKQGNAFVYERAKRR